MPYSVKLSEDEYKSDILAHLESIGFPEALDRPSDKAQVFLTDGFTSKKINSAKLNIVGVPFVLPYGMITNLIERNLIGLSANQYILDTMLNEAAQFTCGLPPEIDRY